MLVALIPLIALNATSPLITLTPSLAAIYNDRVVSRNVSAS